MDRTALLLWLDNTLLLGIALSQWALAIGAALLTWVVMMFGLRAALHRAQALADRSRNHVDDMLVNVFSNTNRGLLTLAAVLVGLGVLELPVHWRDRVSHLWFLALALQIGLWGSRALRLVLASYVARHASSGMTQVSASATLMSWGVNIALWSVVLLAVLSNLGVNITAFVASLGVGGIAVALAVQTILGDLFASLSIAVDKPFEVGDFITFDAIAGTVAHVGIRSTRIRALSGQEVIVSNTDLLKQTINNFKRLQERRIVFGFGITYDTAPEQAAEIPALVRRVVEANPLLRFDRAHLKGFGDSALEYEVVYIVQDPDYNRYMDAQQQINLGLMRELSALEIDFAFPTRTVVVSGELRTSSGLDLQGPVQRAPERQTAQDSEPRRMPRLAPR